MQIFAQIIYYTEFHREAQSYTEKKMFEKFPLFMVFKMLCG